MLWEVEDIVIWAGCKSEVVEEGWKKGERGCRPNLEEIREAVSQEGWGGGLKGRLGARVVG